MMHFEPVIGLEVHAQLATDTKIFCGCPTRFGAAPNSNVCPVCLGLPGALPVLNRRVVEFALLMGLATHCRINPVSVFARKNYFYPDLPKGYQISQYDRPLAEHGRLEIESDGARRVIGITRIHMEEDAGKLLHDEGNPVSYIDLNRAGVPLIEIVSDPDIRSPEEAAAYLRGIHEILVYLRICDGNMEEGSFRCDANVSLRSRGSDTFGTRTELKNLNSFRFVQRALEFEIKRQGSLLENGRAVVQETRLWDETRGMTLVLRSKEEAHDYRYFPDPDLTPLTIDRAWIDELANGLPELPREKRDRFVNQYGLPPYDAGVLTSDAALADYFEETATLSGQPKTASNWIMAELMKFLNEDRRKIGDCRLRPAALAEMIRLVGDGTISGKMGKEIIAEMYASGRAPREIIAEKGLVQITDEAALEETIRKVIAASPDQAAQYRAGREKLFGFFVGQAMKATAGRANPQIINDLLRRLLK